MIKNDFIFNYLKSAYSENGSISSQFDNIIKVLQVDKNQAIDAFYEIYSTEKHPIIDEDPFYKNYFHEPSHTLIEHLCSKAPIDNVDRLAISYIVFDITKEKIQHYGKKLSVEDINLALNNIELINFDLGAFIQSINNHTISPQKNDLKRSIQALGGITRSRKYQAIKKQIFYDWNSSNYHSYAQCARKHAEIHQLSTKTIENWLSKEFSKPK
ncbi:hypothetical protein QR665_12205 [Acinetobacter gerneri]|uniref:hypothetical protein n=1 Tax=Acinetobacter gerneri TaxID=202952 RepID=UPI002936CA6F|nr:hypothetical protein [Acinetobacter gerneri]MDV2440225.1 hypothetical protein [Acinetobacter gerneri]